MQDFLAILFTRTNCPLCEEAWEVFDRAGVSANIHRQDIDAREDWVKSYAWRIPVLRLANEAEFDVALENQMQSALEVLIDHMDGGGHPIISRLP